MDFYASAPIDCFIQLSSTEGLPVSIMEALSFGIPVIATDVGGVSELISRNGILLKNKMSADDVADAIICIYNMDSKDIEMTRQASYDMWKAKFNANDNIHVFKEILRKYL